MVASQGEISFGRSTTAQSPCPSSLTPQRTSYEAHCGKRSKRLRSRLGRWLIGIRSSSDLLDRGALSELRIGSREAAAKLLTELARP
jgi:hypothetical protein